MFLRSIIITSITLFLVTASASASGIATAYTDPTTGMDFVEIPGGTFLMGDDLDEWATPAHEVTVGTFLLGKYEVTFDQYAPFASESGKLLPSDNGWGFGNRPVINVSWPEAIAYTEWLSEKTGKNFRLPTEAEWEFAARGGVSTAYPWGDEVGSNKANCDGCGSNWDRSMTAPVGSFEPNGYGLYDVVGNVYEWTLDTRHDSYEGAPTDGSAWTGEHQDKVNRGGSWYQPPLESTVTRRCWDEGSRKRPEYGFRVLLEQ